MKTYKILFNYYSEGWKFEDGEFGTVKEAVNVAITKNYNPFLIVQVVDWEAVETDTK